MAIVTQEKRVAARHLNVQGTMHGGELMKWMDNVCSNVAEAHSERFCVTAHVDDFDFRRPICRGDTVIVTARLTRTWTTSMEIEVCAQVRSKENGEKLLVAHAYYVFVALDENKDPTEVFEYIPRSEQEKEAWEEAGERRVRRLQRREENN